jgi:D-alanyl-D-alanine carboxypeptidase (penicillin-binding protein 5/6)
VIVLVVILGFGGYLVFTQSGTAPAATAVVAAPDIPKPAAYAYVAPPGESALNISGSTDFPAANGTLGTGGGTAAVPIASISKLITALVILDRKPLTGTDAGPTLFFDKADVDLYDKYYVLGASVASMPNGSSMSEQDALEMMLIDSACNYAEAVSTWAFGSQTAFLAATKSWLAAHSLTSTKIFEPTGLDDRNVSTPADLIAIGRLALANPVVASIVAQPSANIPGVGEIGNTNDLLMTDGVNGIKTGTLDAGSDLLFSSTLAVPGSASLSVVGVDLEGASRGSVDSSAKSMLAGISSGFHQARVVKKGQSFGKYTTPWGDDATVVAADSASVLSWSDSAISSSVTTKHISTGVDGTVVGSVTVTAGPKKVTVPLVLDGDLAGPDVWWRFTHPFDRVKG